MEKYVYWRYKIMGKKRNQRRADFRKAEKRKMMLRNRRQRNMKIMLGVSVVLIAMVGIIVVTSMSNNSNDYNDDKIFGPIQSPDDGSETEFSIPLSEIGDTARFYSYDVDGVDVKFFAVKGSDKEVHVAFDACDVCFSAKKGYRHSGNVMLCINCGNQYSINSLGTENTAGGCWPSYLPMRIDDDYIIINEFDLSQKKWMF
jgi:uncharacterized membrane protein